MPYIDTQVQSLLGSYIAVILPRRANHPGSPPTIHQCLEDGACGVLAAVAGLSQSVSFSQPAQEEGGEQEVSGGHSKWGYGKIKRGFVCWEGRISELEVNFVLLPLIVFFV